MYNIVYNVCMLNTYLIMCIGYLYIRILNMIYYECLSSYDDFEFTLHLQLLCPLSATKLL